MLGRFPDVELEWTVRIISFLGTDNNSNFLKIDTGRNGIDYIEHFSNGSNFLFIQKSLY